MFVTFKNFVDCRRFATEKLSKQTDLDRKRWKLRRGRGWLKIKKEKKSQSYKTCTPSRSMQQKCSEQWGFRFQYISTRPRLFKRWVCYPPDKSVFSGKVLPREYEELKRLPVQYDNYFQRIFRSRTMRENYF